MSQFYETYVTGAPGAPSVPAPMYQPKENTLWVAGRTNTGPGGQSCVFRTEVTGCPKIDPKLVVVVAEALAAKLVQGLPLKNEGRTEDMCAAMAADTRSFGILYPVTELEKAEAEEAKKEAELLKARARTAALRAEAEQADKKNVA